ncbi:hypothetical protein JB92DRAFT_3125219 [Gautieria morchelliformis]|nr:hypothetical protein JB92DRAFT_3125219 [Gautieria morchelliformis]
MPTTHLMKALSAVVTASAATKPWPSRPVQNSKRMIKEADASEPSPSPQIVKKARVTAPSTMVATQALPSSETTASGSLRVFSNNFLATHSNSLKGFILFGVSFASTGQH